MTPLCVRVNLGSRGYDIHVTDNNLAGVGAFARQRVRGSLVLVVTDANAVVHGRVVAQALSPAGFQTQTMILPPGESQKSLAAAGILYDHLFDMHADRKTLITAVGGGVVGDLAGFVAATYARGLPLLMVPTTL